MIDSVRRWDQALVGSQEKWRHPAFWAAWVLWGLPEKRARRYAAPQPRHVKR